MPDTLPRPAPQRPERIAGAAKALSGGLPRAQPTAYPRALPPERSGEPRPKPTCGQLGERAGLHDSGPVSVADTIRALGGWATRRELRDHHSLRQIRKACATGEIHRQTEGRFVLPTLEDHRRLAVQCRGRLSHLSAALHHGLLVKTVPEQAWVTIPRDRGTRRSIPEGVSLHRGDLSGDTGPQSRHVTSVLRTVIDCARTLPFDEALTVADSALRSRKVTAAQLTAAATAAKGPGSAQVRRVADRADGRAANPLESVLRALAIEEGLILTPQLQVADSGMFAVVDLGSVDLRLILEADGFETHGTREGLRRDCSRHTEFTIFGWDSLRYTYEHVMFDQEWTRWTFRVWKATRAGTIPESPPRRRFAA
ncbi:MAG TPA: DUF559 domain-containing protein [Phycicoccus sp.]|nr:DUF559 domain-containing protein [Phycicoccus sp.]HQY96288.1 DUF559 domain-containing protein [Phycicoccus sp.]